MQPKQNSGEMENLAVPSYEKRFHVSTFSLNPQALANMYEREESAKVIFGGLAGNCYLVGEVVDGLMLELKAAIKDFKWFKREIKFDFNAAQDALRRTLAHSRTSSPSTPEYMREVADNMNEHLRPDIFRLENTIMIQLGREHVKNNGIMAKLIVVEIMLQWITVMYDDAVHEMVEKVYGDPEFYDSWYGSASCRGIYKRIKKVVDAVSKIETDHEIDLNSNLQIMHAINAMTYKLKDKDGAIVRQSMEACENIGTGLSDFNHALDVFGIS